MKIASSSALEITKFKDNNISGTVTAKDNNSSLLLTIPYDEGWTVYIDGAKIKPQIALDTFINIPLSKGKQLIKLVYYPERLFLGLIISALSITAFLIKVFFMKNK